MEGIASVPFEAQPRGVTRRENGSELLSLVREVGANPRAFWEKHRKRVKEELGTRLLSPDEDWSRAVELVIPIHNNMDDLPALFFSLSKLVVEEKFGLAVVLHNSSDESARIIAEAVEGRARVLRLDSDVLQGAPYAWQFGLAVSRGGIVAQVDADSVVDSQWLRRITSPLSAEGVLAVSGWRRYFGRGGKRSLPLGMREVVAIGSQKLGLTRQFVAGNSAMRGPVVRSLIGGLLGSYATDGDLAAAIEKKGAVITGYEAPVSTRKEEQRVGGVAVEIIQVGLGRLRRSGEYSSVHRRYLTEFIPHYFPRTREILDQWRAGGGESRGTFGIQELQHLLNEHARRCAEEMRRRVAETQAS